LRADLTCNATAGNNTAADEDFPPAPTPAPVDDVASAPGGNATAGNNTAVLVTQCGRGHVQFDFQNPGVGAFDEDVVV